LQGTVTLSARVATPNDSATVRFVVDGQPGPTVAVPNTGAWQTYTTVDAGIFQFAAGTHHVVTLEFPTGALNANYWTATTTSPPATPAPLGPAGAVTGLGAKCLDLAGGSAADGAQAILNTCTAADTQSWTVASDGTLRALGKCLTTDGGAGANGTRVQLRACDGSAVQRWTAQPGGHVVNGQSGMCLEDSNASTADGNPLIIWTCNDGDAGQRWTVPAGWISGYGGACVEVAGVQVQLDACSAVAAQRWSVGSDSTLRALGKCMTVTGGGTANGTRVQVAACGSDSSQKWTAHADGTLVNVLSGTCLDATDWSSAVGTPLQVWACAATANQKWKLPAA
jgi:hypothetical protein